MILTDDFVFVHQPKTGGTFVAKTLVRIYQARTKRGLVHNLPRKIQKRVQRFVTPDFMVLGKHANCREIPEAYRDKPILATVRNPYDRNVSLYEYKWWKKSPFYSEEKMKEIFPRFPDISFEGYLNFLYYIYLPAQVKNIDFDDEHSFGLQTWQFVDFFFENPAEVLAKIGPDYIASQGYKADMHDMRFIRTCRLNQDLFDFLLNAGYARNEIEFILDSPKIFPPVLFPLEGGRSEEQTWQQYYTPELKHLVRTSEELIFAMFPEFDI